MDHRTRERLHERGLGIFMPKLWADAIEAQEQRIAETRDALLRQEPFGRQTIEDFDLGARLNWEAYFLVLAIRQLLYTHAECLEQTGDRRLIEAPQSLTRRSRTPESSATFSSTCTSTSGRKGSCRSGAWSPPASSCAHDGGAIAGA